MEKALNVLKDLCLVINFNSYWQPRVHEAIAELEEAMKPKTCDGCYWLEDSNNSICGKCLRNDEMRDMFESKDNA